MYYHPNIKSDTWPNIPFPDDCSVDESCGTIGIDGPAVAATLDWDCIGEGPAFRKAAAAGASLIGVPYVGVAACWWTGEGSSTAIAFDDGSVDVVMDMDPRVGV